MQGWSTLVCPIKTVGNSSRTRVFAVNLSDAGKGVTGIIRLDQLSALDMLVRRGKASGDVVPDFIMDDVLAKIATIAQ